MADGLVKFKGSPKWHYDFRVNGTRYTGSTGTSNRARAVAWLAQFRGPLEKSKWDAKLGIKPDPTITCTDLLKDWLANHGGNHKIRVERDWTLHILEHIGAKQVLQVETKDLEGIRKKFLDEPSLRNAHQADQIANRLARAKLKGETIEPPPVRRRTNRGANMLMRHLWLVLGWAVKTERLPRLPCKPLGELQEQEPVKTFLRQDQVPTFLALVDSRANLHQMVAIRAMLYLALREDEALHLRWLGFSHDFATYTPVDTKTGENIALPVPEDLRRLLRQVKATAPLGCGWVLPQMAVTGLTRRGTPKQPRKGTVGEPHKAQFAVKAIDRAAAAMGITGLSPHRMRGSCVTMMAKRKVNAFVIKKMGRWRRMETALKYVQIVEDDLAAAQAEVFGG